MKALSPYEVSEYLKLKRARVEIGDISKVLQTLPGVSSTPAYRNDVIVRGGGSSENTFYLDGIEIPNINHFSTQGSSGGPVGIINVDFIREGKLLFGCLSS